MKADCNDSKRDRFLAMLGEEGMTVSAACSLLGIEKSRPAGWAKRSNAFAELYARAREEQAHRFAEVAIDASNGVDDYARAVGRVLQAEEDAAEREENPVTRKARLQLLKALQRCAIDRDKLRVDTLKWYASKVAPKLYGERQSVELSSPEPLKLIVSQE